MTDAYPPLRVLATPDYFLATLAGPYFPATAPAADLAEWWNEWVRDHRKFMRDGLTGLYPEHVTATDFDREFPTLDGRTVGDVCRFLAERVPRPAVRPWLNDRAAGAFLTVRHHLAAAGADASEVRPSATLESHLRSCPEVFGRELHRLAPGLPWVSEWRPVARAGKAVVATGGAVALAGCLLTWACAGVDASATLGIAVAACFVGTVLVMVGSALPPRRMTLGDLVTFRDLARAVAVQQPA